MSTLLLIAGIFQNIAAMRPLYLVVWAALVALSVFLVASMRSRWGRSRPLYRCAALSLLVHFVLAGLAMTVKLVVGDGGHGMGPPIRVRVVDDVSRPGSLDTDTPTTKLLADEAKPVSETTAPVEENKAAAIEAPPLLPMPEPESVAEIAPTTHSKDASSIAADVAAIVAAKEVAPQLTEASSNGKALAVAAPVSSGAEQAATSPYARRNASDRLHWAEQQGGSRQTEAAVAAALEWLSKAQSPDGRWDASRYGAGVEMQVLGQDRGGAGADADPGVTALALLAFLGAGHTHYDGDYRAHVEGGLEFLTRGQSSDGNLASGTGLYAQMYCHSMATFALAEALAVTGDKRLQPPVQRAVNYCLRAQHPSTGGWRYRVGDLGDTSQLGWQLMALWSARRAGIEIPPQTWTGADRFLRSVRRGRHGGLASYRPDGPASTPMTAEALYCRQIVREMLGGPTDANLATEATNQLLATLPDQSRVNLYYWYYGSLALHYQNESNDEAARAWQAWNSALTSVLLDTQQSGGAEAGSWPPSCIWGGYGGRVYTTAMATLCLEVYYRYAPLVESGWTASRPDLPTVAR